MSRPNEKAPAREDAPGPAGRLGFDMAKLESSPLAVSTQLIAARHCLTIERAVLALGCAHG